MKRILYMGFGKFSPCDISLEKVSPETFLAMENSPVKIPPENCQHISQ